MSRQRIIRWIPQYHCMVREYLLAEERRKESPNTLDDWLAYEYLAK